MEGMKRLIIDEVSSFRAEVRAQARAVAAASQLETRRQDRSVVVCLYLLLHLIFFAVAFPSQVAKKS